MSEALSLAEAANSGLLKLLGMVIESASGDEVTISMEIGPEHLQAHGILHGGVHCTLVESAASIGGYLWLITQPGGGHVAGVNNNTDFLRPFTAGRVVATATPIHRGRAGQLWLVVVSDEQGKALARGQVRLHNFAG
jgi:1,4-dihydroxy-2-naphthoyl-CoA hydrolase